MPDNMPQQIPPELPKTTGADVGAIAIKGIIGAIPFVGPLVAEVVCTLIPGQRADRISEFLERLESRIEEVEQKLFQHNLQTPEGADLLEDALNQVARSLSEDRRERVAELMANGLSAETFSHAQEKKLLWLLGELSDPELVWLIYIGRDYDDTMLESHGEFLEWRVAGLSSPENEHNDAALQSSWRRRLLDLGLVESAKFASQGVDIALSGLENAAEDGSLHLTQLGRMLLQSIGEEPTW